MTKQQMVSQLKSISSDMGTLCGSVSDVINYIDAADKQLEGNEMSGKKYDEGKLQECLKNYSEIYAAMSTIKANAEELKRQLLIEIQQEAAKKNNNEVGFENNSQSTSPSPTRKADSILLD